MPSADSNAMTMVGPTDIQSRASKPPPTRTANKGMSQIQEKCCSLRGLTSGTRRAAPAPGSRSSLETFSCSLSFITHIRRGPRLPIPAGARIIAHGSQHREHHDHAETRSGGARDDLRHARKIGHGRHENDHKDVEHRPLTDIFHQLVQTGALSLRAIAL